MLKKTIINTDVIYKKLGTFLTEMSEKGGK